MGHVRGLLVAGDLTEWGNTYEWEAFCDVYGLGRGEKPGSPFPVFEVVGNHDMVHGPWLAAEVAKRHPGGGAYTWDWDDVHLVGLCGRVAPDIQRRMFGANHGDANLRRVGKRGHTATLVHAGCQFRGQHLQRRQGLVQVTRSVHPCLVLDGQRRRIGHMVEVTVGHQHQIHLAQ